MRDQNQPFNYYEVLGVSQDATTDEIRSAYRREAMKWHPDQNKDPNAPRMMQFINEAWEMLGDTERRRQYDRRSAEGARSDQYQDPVKVFRESILPWLLERATDLYDVLDVSTNATLDEIDRAYIYRQQTIEENPHFAGDPAASAFMSLVRVAHFVLSDPEFRAEYDRHYFSLRARIAEEERARQEATRREFRRQERQREQARREAELHHQREEAERRRRQEEREKRERRVREEHERREQERHRRRTENQYQREGERQSSARAQHGGSTTKPPSRSFEHRQKPRIFDNVLLAWSLVGLAVIIVTVPFILHWITSDDESPKSEPINVRSNLIATPTPRRVAEFAPLPTSSLNIKPTYTAAPEQHAPPTITIDMARNGPQERKE